MGTSQLPEEPRWDTGTIQMPYRHALRLELELGYPSFYHAPILNIGVFSIKQPMFSMGPNSFSPSPQKEGEDSHLREGVAATAVSCPRTCGPQVHSLWNRKKGIITDGKLYKDWCGETR